MLGYISGLATWAWFCSDTSGLEENFDPKCSDYIRGPYEGGGLEALGVACFKWGFRAAVAREGFCAPSDPTASVSSSCQFQRWRREKSDTPYFSVHSSCNLISDFVTVGLVLSKPSKKSSIVKGRTNNSLFCTCFNVIGTAAGSKGEHGVHLYGMLLPVRLKWLALRAALNGCIRASLTAVAMSDPE